MSITVKKDEIVPLTFNPPQLRFVLNLPKINGSTTIWGRATGKTTIIAWLMHYIITHLPRSTWGIIGATFQQLLTVTLDNLLKALYLLGYERDVDYVIGVKPPKHFGKAITPKTSYDNVITFSNGTSFRLISQDRSATSPRGRDLDGIIADEALEMNKAHFDETISPAIRGNRDLFKHIPLHEGKFFFTSMPTSQEGSWLLKNAAYYDTDTEVNEFDKIRQDLIELEYLLLEEQDRNAFLELWRQIKEGHKKLNFYPSEGKLKHFYSEANVFENINNVGFKYVKQQYEELTPLAFKVEIMNQRLNKIEGGFYPTFDRYKHTYKGDFNYSFIDNQEYNFNKIKSKTCEQDKDLSADLPLIISVDWGANINFMVVAQYHKGMNLLKFINVFYAKSPDILDVIFHKFVAYYEKHKADNNRVEFWYDPTGNSRTANSSKTFAMQGQEILQKAGWSVVPKSRGVNHLHNQKYNFISNVFYHNGGRFPNVKINIVNCKELVVSIEQAKCKDVGGEIKKDKSDERNKKLNQAETTHASDAFDILLFSKFYVKEAHTAGQVDLVF